MGKQLKKRNRYLSYRRWLRKLTQEENLKAIRKYNNWF